MLKPCNIVAQLSAFASCSRIPYVCTISSYPRIEVLVVLPVRPQNDVPPGILGLKTRFPSSLPAKLTLAILDNADNRCRYFSKTFNTDLYDVDALIGWLTEELKEALDAYRGDLSYGKAIRKLIEERAELLKAYERGCDEGWNKAVDLFIDSLYEFYGACLMRAEERGLNDLALFTVPCKYCGKPMVFTHKDGDWAEKIRPSLWDAFRNWYHVKCRKGYS